MTTWQQEIPQPIYEENPGYCELYNFAWELARKHVRHIEGMPADPYMDEAFCDSRIWIWDTCFMALFCKYAPKSFPGVESFRNFLDVMHNGVPLPGIEVGPDEPFWTHPPKEGKAPIMIQHPDNPPLFAWAEYENLLMTGDRERCRMLLHETKVLQKHFEWLESLTEPSSVPSCHAKTAWMKREKGYLWSGTPSGMDNTPRGRKDADDPAEPAYDFFWVDALAQQALSARCIARMAALIDDEQLSLKWNRRYAEKRELLENYYWDETDGLYYDIGAEDLAFRKVMTPASFWPLLAGTSSPERARRCLEKVLDPALLGGRFPWVSVARNDAKLEPLHGQYWRGAVWVPTAYAGICGLMDYGFMDEARSTALAFLEQIYRTWREFEPHTIWECYAPNSCEPGYTGNNSGLVRKDFCGWSALMPISAFIECIIGIRQANAFTKTVTWNPPKDTKGRIGCLNYRFGELVLDLVKDGAQYEVHASAPCTLLLNGQKIELAAGPNTFSEP